MIVSVALSLLLGALLFAGCSTNKLRVPDGLSREEAALYVALSEVCPKDRNHSKAEYLTFRFEGWSFEQAPEAINDYLEQYIRSGNASLMQLSDEMLEQMGLLKVNTDADSFYGVGERVYAEGRGAIFTFELKEGQSTDSSSVRIAVKKFISDMDTSGFDVELKYEGGEWRFVQRTDPWSMYDFVTSAPNDPNDPQK